MNTKLATKIGATALRIYANHMISFTIGASAGAFVGFGVAETVFVALLKSRGLL